MSVNLVRLQEDFPDLDTKPISRVQGATAYRLKLPVFPEGREFEWAELLLPKGFPEVGVAKIVLSPDAVLRIPHVEATGALCIDGEPGAGVGFSAEDRILSLLCAYQDKFLKPWLAGKLDGDFSREPLNYWHIKVGKTRSPRDPVRAVWTVDDCPQRASVKEGVLLLPGRIVIAADDELAITSQIIRSLGVNARQRIRVRIADIPISSELTPTTWPQSSSDLDRLLAARLRPPQQEIFRKPIRQRGREVHRIVLLRSPSCGFAYVLPGGPPTTVEVGKTKRAYPPLMAPLPLRVTRLDPSWTVGRDQHPEVAYRQEQHVLVLGAGALGSPVVEHLAKAGVGSVALVDPDELSTANIGRHLLGAESIDLPKADAVAQRVNLGHPATIVTPYAMSVERWLRENTLEYVDVVIDLTGDPDVRWQIDLARHAHPRPLLIGWMEPYVAAAHTCSLPSGTGWMQGNLDPMERLQAVTWPKEVIRQEPGCSSRFQSYTAAAAAYAVALVAEHALRVIDGNIHEAQVTSWVRGQGYLDQNWPGLELVGWAQPAKTHDGLIIRRAFP